MEHDACMRCSATFGPAMRGLALFIYLLALICGVGYQSHAHSPSGKKNANGATGLVANAAAINGYAFVSEPITQHHFTAYEYSETRESEDDETSHDNEHGGASASPFADYYASIIDYVHHCAGTPPPIEGKLISFCVLHAVFRI